MNDDDQPRKASPLHVLGESLDTLSLHDFDVRLALLRAEIDRPVAARERKKAALDTAGSVFKTS